MRLMPRTYRAAVLPAPGAPLRLEERPAPDLAPGAVLLHVLLSEVCGTDVHLRHGRLAGVPYPLIPGHVSVGTVAALRGEARDVDGVAFREGDVAAFLDVHGTCGACHACLVDKETTRCPHRRVYGITFPGDAGLHGGWAEAMHLLPGTKLLRLPDGLPPETYMAGGCGLNTAFHAVERAALRLGDAVVILGAGAVGQSAVAFAALCGADPVVAVGAPDERLATARRMGATHTLSIEALSPGERLDAVRALTHGRGADAVIEAAGAPEAVVQGAALCRDGGTLVVAGQYTDNGPALWPVHELLNRKHLTVRAVWGSDFSHFYKSIGVLARHHARIPWKDLVTARYPLDQCDAALDAVERRTALKALIAP
jgi:threonine dehydrogenase-like Zn-dependent dehydrogenase